MRVSALTVCAVLFAACLSTAAFGEPKASVITRTGKGKNAKAFEKTVGMERCKDGALRVRIPASEIGPDVDSIEIVPDFAHAKKGGKGYFILPDGRMGGFHEDDGVIGKGAFNRPFNIMPLFGMKKDEKSFMGVVKGLKLECGIQMRVEGGVYELFPKFFIKEMGVKPYEDIVVDYYLLKEGDDDYCAMARKYRAWQLGRGEVVPLRERAKDNPVLKYTAESMFVRVKHGWKALNTEKKIENQTRENEPPIHVAISFDQFMDIMRRMKDAGVDQAEICSVGGTAGGFDGRFPDVLPIPEEFGGAAKFKESVKYGQSLGYQMTCHFATTAILKVSSAWNEDYVCKRQDGSLLKAGLIAGGRTHRLNPKIYVSKFMERDWQTFRDFGFKGCFHLDVISRIMPYTDFDKDHFLNRKESGEYQRQIAESCQEVFGGFGSEAGLDWIASNLDFALYISWYPGYSERNTHRSPLVDAVVPFWQLVYHGIIISNPFYGTIDPTIKRKERNISDNNNVYSCFPDVKTQVLKLVEYGGRPVFYYSDYKDVSPLKRAYDIYEPLKHLQYEFMDWHGEIAPKVVVTRYGNGEETVCNYSDKPFSYRGRDVAPLDYALYKTSEPK